MYGRKLSILSSRVEIRNIWTCNLWDKIIAKSYLIAKPGVQNDVERRSRENIWGWPPCALVWGVTVTSCFPMWLWLSLVCVFVSLDVNSLCSGSETSNLTHIPVSKTVHSIYSLKTLLIIWCSESYAWNIYKETWARLLVLREVGLCRQGKDLKVHSEFFALLFLSVLGDCQYFISVISYGLVWSSTENILFLCEFAELVALSKTEFVPRISAFLSFLIGIIYMYLFYFLEEAVFLQKKNFVFQHEWLWWCNFSSKV